MAEFGRSDDLRGARFHGADLRGARFAECDLSGVVMRGVDVREVQVDAPWLAEGPFLVNDVDVTPFVESELDRRFPGRAQRRAEDPDGLRAAWEALEQAWAATVSRAEAMPEGTLERNVDGEWSLSQTLRHLVHATDIWLGRGVLEQDDLHPLGLSHGVVDGSDVQPPWPEVLAARADRQAQVRGFLAGVTPEQLDEERRNPHSPEHPETVRSCVHVVLEEEWEHLRFAERDLAALAPDLDNGA
jgi:hypothetical protein